MDPGVQKIFKEQFQKLPPELKAAITASDLRQKLFVLTQKYRLHIDKAATLENEVVMVLMGMEDPEEFVRNIERELGIDASSAQALAKDVSEQIFHPIRTRLDEFLKAENERRTAVERVSAPPVIPSVAPASIAKPVTPLSTAIIPTTPALASGHPEEPKAPSPTPQTPAPSSSNIVAGKLGGGATLNLRSILGGQSKQSEAPLPKENSLVGQTATTPPPIATPPANPDTARVDPYREPI